MVPYYFSNCCATFESEYNFFAVLYVPPTPLTLGTTYKIITDTVTLCGIYIDFEIPTGSPVYSDIVDIINYGLDCESCLRENPCFPPRPTPLPLQPREVNECNVITIFPMQIECISVNPTTPISTDGEMSVSITGGTPPYKIFWSNGNVAPAIQNLTVGKYTATVVDYYGDFSATTTCELVSEYDCTFSASVQNYIVI